MAVALSNPLVTLRPDAPNFAPSPWGDQFLNYKPDIKVIQGHEEIVKALEEDIRRELVSVSDKPLIEQLRLIDSIERLGVSYHFDDEIESALQRIHEMRTDSFSNDLFITSLRFCLLRHHGFNISSDVFKKFLNPNGSLKEEVASDVQGLLSLYEACHLRVHGEDLIDEVLPLTISKLKSIHGQASNPTLKDRIAYALKRPIHHRVTRVECGLYMQVYQEDDPLHNKTLLSFAKADFYFLQASHRTELSEMCRWGKMIDIPSKLPLRDRIVEAYFWTTSLYSEPQCALARKISTIAGQLITSIDDIYDSYATLEELEVFTEAINRWDRSCLEQLPEKLRWFYETLILDAHDEIESWLAPVGRSQYLAYAKKEMKALVQTYMTEAKWRNEKYIPTLEEYIANDMYRNMAYIVSAAYIFLGTDMAAEHEFEWLCSLPKPIKSLSYHLRILNDIGGKKFDEQRGQSALFLECYMKEYGLSFEQACEKIYEKTQELWKDVNESMIQPTEVPRPVVNCVLNMTRLTEIIYDGAGFTLVNDNMKRYIKTLYIDSIPM